ncbi:hypothetical protein BTHI11S_02761 [Bosea thiooxidans]
MLAIDEGPFQGEVDEADGDAVLPDRDLAQQQRRARGALQDAERLAHPARGRVDLVEEEEARDIRLLELAQHELQRRRLAVIRLADHDGGVDHRQHMAHLVQELDRAGAVDEMEGIAEELDRRDARLRAHLMRARFRRGIADRVAALHRACSRQGAAPHQDALEQGRLAALEGTDDGDASRPRASGTGCGNSILCRCGHGFLLRIWPGRRKGGTASAPHGSGPAGTANAHTPGGGGRSGPTGVGRPSKRQMGKVRAERRPTQAICPRLSRRAVNLLEHGDATAPASHTSS